MNFALCLALLFFQQPAALEFPRVDSPAPPLELRKLLQAPEGSAATWENLKGKAVVLEFWATWCGGSVDNIPHLNELAEKFKNRPVQFISITDEEDANLVSRFLQAHPISGWVAFDDGEKTFRRYDVEGRPQTVLVDPRGILKAVTSPGGVTPKVLEDLLVGKSLNIHEPLGSPFIGTEPAAPTPLMQVLIRPAGSVEMTRNSPGARREIGGRYEVWGLTLQGLLSDTYGIPPERIEVPVWGRQTRYDLSVTIPQDGAALRQPVVRQLLAATFQLEFHRETREAEVYVVRKMPGREPNLRAATTPGQAGKFDRNGKLEAIGARLSRLTSISQIVLGHAVFDETGLTGRYDYDLKWDGKDPASFVAAIRDQLALELISTRKPLEFLVIDSAREPRTF